jgi:cytochrome c oxidase subunit 2
MFSGWSGLKPSERFRRSPPVKAAKMWSGALSMRTEKLMTAGRAGKPVKVIISSEDVLHSFYVPAFRLKMDAVPGMDTYAWFKQDIIGSYTIYCAEYCGLKHSAMISEVQVLSPQEFESWYNAKDQHVSDLEAGKKLLRVQGCLSCHSLDGSPLVAPTFKGLFGKETVVEKRAVNDHH